MTRNRSCPLSGRCVPSCLELVITAIPRYQSFALGTVTATKNARIVPPAGPGDAPASRWKPVVTKPREAEDDESSARGESPVFAELNVEQEHPSRRDFVGSSPGEGCHGSTARV